MSDSKEQETDQCAGSCMSQFAQIWALAADSPARLQGGNLCSLSSLLPRQTCSPLCLQHVTADSVTMRTSLAKAAHPAVFELGLQFADGTIRGANARCLAMLAAFKQLIQVSWTLCGSWNG